MVLVGLEQTAVRMARRFPEAICRSTAHKAWTEGLHVAQLISEFLCYTF